MALICGFAAVLGTVAPAGAATTESFGLTSAAVSGQSSVTWQGPPVNPPSTPNAFPDATSPISLTGQIDSATGNISGASLSFPPIGIVGQGQQTYFAFSDSGGATGNFNSSTGALTLNDALTLTFTVPGSPVGLIECVSTPIDVALSGTWDSTSQDVTLSASGFTIPQFPANSGRECSLANTDLNASPGGTAGSVGNAMTIALHGQFAQGLPTTTTLAASPNSPQLAGTAVTLTATVADPSAAGTPTGNVNFVDNGVSLGTEAVDGAGTATLTTSNLPQVPSQQITAIYAGDTTYSTSTSSALSYTVQPLPAISSDFPSQITAGSTSFPTPTPFTVTVASSPGGAAYSNNLFLYLGVASNDGLVPAQIQLSYQDQAGNWCPLGLSYENPPSGSPLPRGTTAAAFFSGWGAPPCGFSPAFSLQPGTSLTLNLEVAFTQAPYEDNPFAGSISLVTALETGSCTSASACTATAPLSGANAVTSQATSTIVPQGGIGVVPTSLKDHGWPSTGTVRTGFDLELGAFVVPDDSYYYTTQNPTGTVQFFIDGQLAASPTIPARGGGKGNAPNTAYDPGILAPGVHTETINYLGDQTYAPSTLSETFTVVGPPSGTPFVCAVNNNLVGGTPTDYNAFVTATGAGVPTAATSGTSVAASDVNVTLDLDPVSVSNSVSVLNNSQANQMIGFSPGASSTNAGPVTFASSPSGTDILGTWSGLSATIQVTGDPGDDVPVGVSSISFNFGISGAADCTSVSQPATIGTVGIIATILDVSPPGSAPAGTPITMAANVSPLPSVSAATGGDAATPGQVDFYDGTTYLGTAAVVVPPTDGATTGTATLALNNLSTGDHQLSAQWSGYSGVPPSTSNTVDYQVGTNTTTTVASSANPANAADPVTFTATVSPPEGATTMPTGDVSFSSDGNPISSCQDVALSMDSPPTATCTTSFGAGESHAIVATYGGDDTYLGSSADPLTQTTLAGTNTTILSTKDPSPAGPVTFWAGVSPSSGIGTTPTGTVAFTIDGSIYKPCNAAPLGPGGGASCTVSFRAGTSHRVSATYPGSATYSGSSSSTITQTVTSGTGTTGPKDTGGSATLAPGKSLTAGQQLSAASYRLVMQRDGNLVEYQGSKALWASHTAGHPGTGVVMQKDGNLVEYFHGHAIWASGTAGHPGAHLTLQASDGNVVIYQGATALWSTGT